MNRVLNFAVVAVSALIMASAKVDAAVIDITEGSTSGYTMTDGNTYVIQNSVTFSNATAGCSGISVESNSTVVIYVPKDVTLTAIGANGKGRTGGGAGICVPSNATLIVTGEGMVVATGGDAGKGSDGKNGYDGWGYGGGSTIYYGGKGGAGGDGGGGAGAAIGGRGGIGGISGVGASGVDGDHGGNNGGNGGDGEASDAMGCVYILGSLLAQTHGGISGSNGVAGVCGAMHVHGLYNSYVGCAGGGGGGGGGGAGSAPRCHIGAGGQGGGGGGGGGGGAALSRLYSSYDDTALVGGGGLGGQSEIAVGESGGAKSNYGGQGGAGGAAGTEGGAGELYVSSTAVVDVEREMLSAETHLAAQYTITFDANGGTLSSEVDSATATLGCSLPDCIPTPVWQGYVISGWKDDNGMQYYDGNGRKALSSYPLPSDIVLHAEWVDDPAALVIAPDNGTTFEESLTISMSSSVDDATIYYTLDGSDPTIESPVYRKKFRIYGKTIVKAIAVSAGWTNREVVVSCYALGQCPDPVIISSGGDVFTHGQVRVSIIWDCEDGVLRYTTDGGDVTETSPEYTGTITIDDTTTIKAKAFGETYFDSKQVERTVTRELATVDTPVIVASTTFTGTKNKVKISCTTDQAVIYYTTDGSEPNIASTRYEKPFCVTGSCSIKAMAVRDEFLDSEVATLAVTRQWSIGETMGKPDHLFATGGDEGFVRMDDATAALGESMMSGIIKNSQTSILSTVVVGPGVLSFKWKTSCEEDYPQHEWDHAEFVVDGDVVMKLDGITDWQQVVHPIIGDGVHNIEWKYIKDDEEYEGEDCMWVSEYSWKSDYVQTQTTDNPVPYSWLAEKCSDVVDEYDCYEKVAKQLSLNGRLTVEQCYVAGVDPESPTNDFTVAIKMIDGVPEITWHPDLEESRKYMIWGRATLDDSSSWQYPTNSHHRFFKVTVEMP